MCVIASVVVKKDRNKVWGLVIKITTAMSWTSTFTRKMTMISNFDLSLNFLLTNMTDTVPPKSFFSPFVNDIGLEV